MFSFTETSVCLFILIIGLTSALQNRWYQPGIFGQQRQFFRDPQRFPFPSFYGQNVQFPNRNMNYDPLNGRFMGFNRPMVEPEFLAAVPTPNKEKNEENRKMIQEQTRKLKQVIKAAVEPSTSNRAESSPETTEGPCDKVVCPSGTLCEVHPSQCRQPTCPEFAVCTEIKAIDSCTEPVKVGSCSYNYDSYFYNSTSGSCEKFVYSGCEGSNNRFSTLKQCQQVCVPSKKFCHLQKEIGPCRAAKPRWYYNQLTRKCEEFLYGGCRGNTNNFVTERECLKKCSV